ncbi:MAG: hypothetical protein EOO40_05810 [Deltaproteobacteria bacterium]|nr:MAG: hypothetical protein EOO40_05810 [Deltaproteobacteria bacterium]
MASPDPSSGGLGGQVAGQLAKEMQTAQSHIQQLEKEQSQVSGSKEAFNQTLQAQQSSQTQQVAPVEQIPGQSATAVTDVLRQAKAQAVTPSTRIGATEKVAESKLQNMIDNLVNGQDKMTKIMQMALSGRQFGPSELLAMQAGVYRYSQELDLTSKVVQQATSGIKQTLNTQV